MARRRRADRPSALIVGASGGVGSLVAARLRRRFTTVGIDRQKPPRTWQGPFFQVSLRDDDSIAAAISLLSGLESQISVAVFAHGSYRRTPLEKYSSTLFDDCLWDNFTSTFWLVQHVAARMREQGGGRIVFLTSQAAVHGGLDPAYAAAKAAVQALMKSIAREYGAKGIRCNAISPGPIETTMAKVMDEKRRRFYEKAIPIGRFCTPAEVADAVAFVAAGDVDALNGQTLDVDGGLIRR